MSYVLIPGGGLVELQFSEQLIPGAGVLQEREAATGSLSVQESGTDTLAITGSVVAVATASTGVGSGKVRRSRDQLNEVEAFAPWKPRKPEPKPVKGRIAVVEVGSDGAAMLGQVVIAGRVSAQEEGADGMRSVGIVRHSRAALSKQVMRLLFGLEEAA